MRGVVVGKALSIVLFVFGVLPLMLTLAVIHWILKVLGYLDRRER